MKNILLQSWWKYIGVVILLYVFIAGFYIPLKPGIVSTSPERVKSGQTLDITIDGYNTKWNDGQDDRRCFIKIDQDHELEAQLFSIVNRKRAIATFQLPNENPGGAKFMSASLVVVNQSDGYINLPQAITIETTDQPDSSNQSSWTVDNIPVVKPEWVFEFPFIGILYETNRNMFFHVAIWFAMFSMLVASLIYSIRYLITKNLDDDALAAALTHVSILFGIFGMITGSIWAKNSWGAYWTNDPKLNMAAIAVMIFIAYAILRKSILADDQRARISSVYNIFAFAAMIPLIFIIPRITSSLHPGNGGNPAMGGEDLDDTLRLVFYPAMIGLAILGFWISTIMYRMRRIELKKIDDLLK